MADKVWSFPEEEYCHRDRHFPFHVGRAFYFLEGKAFHFLLFQIFTH